MCHFLSDLLPLRNDSCICQDIIFLILNQNTWCGYSNEPSKWDESFVLEPKANVKTGGQENILQVYAQNAYVI